MSDPSIDVQPVKGLSHLRWPVMSSEISESDSRIGSNLGHQVLSRPSVTPRWWYDDTLPSQQLDASTFIFDYNHPQIWDSWPTCVRGTH